MFHHQEKVGNFIISILSFFRYLTQIKHTHARARTHTQAWTLRERKNMAYNFVLNNFLNIKRYIDSMYSYKS